jgi:hypothetical protein
MRYDLHAQLGGVALSRYDALRIRVEILETVELPTLAALCAEMTFWRMTCDETAPDTGCTFAREYRRALRELNDLHAELVALGSFLAA